MITLVSDMERTLTERLRVMTEAHDAVTESEHAYMLNERELLARIMGMQEAHDAVTKELDALKAQHALDMDAIEWATPHVSQIIAERDALALDAAKWKQMAEFQYAVRVYPNDLDLGMGALDAYFKGWTYGAGCHEAMKGKP